MKNLEHIRKIAIVLLVVSAVVWLWQVNVIASARDNLISAKNHIEALRGEIESKNSTDSRVGSFLESFLNGATLGIFDDEGMFGTVRRYERWVDDVRKRGATYSSQIEIATERIRISTIVRNCAATFSVIAILILVFIPSKSDIEQAD